jgi:hypothetical protein
MAIRGMEPSDVPPPLPPPRLVPINGPVDPALHFKESMRRDDYARPDADSFGHSFTRRRDPSFKSDFSDDGYHSFESFRFVPSLDWARGRISAIPCLVSPPTQQQR